MRFAVIDPDGTGLPWAARLHDEGCDVLMYLHERSTKRTGDGIVNKTNSLYELLAWAKLKPTIAVFMFSGFGKRGPKVPLGATEFAAAGIPCVLGDEIMDRLENDRDWGAKLAAKLGVRQPPSFRFSDAEGAAAFCKAHPDKEWFFKPNDMSDCDTTSGGKGNDLAEYITHFRTQFGNNHSSIVQMKIPGIAISTAAWFNGHKFLEPYEGTIEHKKFMNDELGPSTGCCFNVVWMYDEKPKIAHELKFAELAPILAAKHCNPGLLDINALIAEEAGPWGPAKVPYFLEWTPRLGWDSEATSFKLLNTRLCDFLTGLAYRTLPRSPFDTSRLGFGLRVSLSPYPFVPKQKEPLKPTSFEKPLSGFTSVWRDEFVGYDVMKGPRGFVASTDAPVIGVVTEYGQKLSTISEKALKYAGSLLPKSLQYRTDGGKVLAKDAKKLIDLGYSVPKGIIE
jgi:phosphoribosylamine-glycine ligase